MLDLNSNAVWDRPKQPDQNSDVPDQNNIAVAASSSTCFENDYLKVGLSWVKIIAMLHESVVSMNVKYD